MKKIILTVLCLSLLPALVFAGGSKENQNVNMAVMQGPTGFSSVMLPSYVNLSVYPSPNEAVAKLVNGDLDMAVLPSNTADTLIEKGVKIKKLAVVGEGMLFVIGTDENATTLAVPGAGGTPDIMANRLYPDYEKSYSVTAPAQLAQLVIAGKVSLAILPQPFVSMVMSKNPNVKIISNVQDEWKKQTGENSYPMSILVAREDYGKDNKDLVKKVMKDYEKSVKAVLANPHEAALLIEEKGIMAADTAETAIPLCALVFKEL